MMMCVAWKRRRLFHSCYARALVHLWDDKVVVRGDGVGITKAEHLVVLKHDRCGQIATEDSAKDSGVAAKSRARDVVAGRGQRHSLGSVQSQVFPLKAIAHLGGSMERATAR